MEEILRLFKFKYNSIGLILRNIRYLSGLSITPKRWAIELAICKKCYGIQCKMRSKDNAECINI